MLRSFWGLADADHDMIGSQTSTGEVVVDAHAFPHVEAFVFTLWGSATSCLDQVHLDFHSPC